MLKDTIDRARTNSCAGYFCSVTPFGKIVSVPNNFTRKLTIINEIPDKMIRKMPLFTLQIYIS